MCFMNTGARPVNGLRRFRLGEQSCSVTTLGKSNFHCGAGLSLSFSTNNGQSYIRARPLYSASNTRLLLSLCALHP